jgi:hypothetical protein
MVQELKKDTVITIKKQSLVLKVNRTDVIAADPTYDGVLFQLKHGMIIQLTDSFLPSESKQLIANSINSFPNANLLVDFDNYKKPIVASVT